jgi:hypothetical protein
MLSVRGCHCRIHGSRKWSLPEFRCLSGAIEIHGNVVDDTADSYIIDVINGTRSGTGYGGEGIYRDVQTADVEVENNVVFNVDGNAIRLTEGLASVSETANRFKNNIFAFWQCGNVYSEHSLASGLPSTPYRQVQCVDNLFVFRAKTDQAQPTEVPSARSRLHRFLPGFLGDSGTYSGYQLLEGSGFWSDTGNRSNVADAFKIQQNQSQSGLTLNGTTYSWSGASPVSLDFSQSANNWETGTHLDHHGRRRRKYDL